MDGAKVDSLDSWKQEVRDQREARKPPKAAVADAQQPEQGEQQRRRNVMIRRTKDGGQVALMSLGDYEQLIAEVEELKGQNSRMVEVMKERHCRENNMRPAKGRSGYAFAGKCSPYSDHAGRDVSISAWVVVLSTPYPADMTADDVRAQAALDLPKIMIALGGTYLSEDVGSPAVLYDSAEEALPCLPDDIFDRCCCYRATFEQNTKSGKWDMRLYLTRELPSLTLP